MAQIPLSMFAPYRPGPLPSQLGGIRSRLADAAEIRKQQAMPGFQAEIQRQFASGAPDKMQMLAAYSGVDPVAAMEAQFGGGIGGAQQKWQYDISKNAQAGEIQRKIAELGIKHRNAIASGDRMEADRIRGEMDLLYADLQGLGITQRRTIGEKTEAESIKQAAFADKQEEDDFKAFRGIRDRLAQVHSQFTQAIQRYVDKYLVAVNSMKQLQPDSEVIAQAKSGNRTSQNLLLNFINKLVDPGSAVLQGEADRFAPTSIGKDFAEMQRYLSLGEGKVLDPQEVDALVAAGNAVGKDLYTILGAMTSSFQKAYDDEKKILVADPSPGVKALIQSEGLMQILNRPLVTPPAIQFSSSSAKREKAGTGGLSVPGGAGGVTPGGWKIPPGGK